MINQKIELDFEITLRKNKRKIKLECHTNKYSDISTDICIDDKPMDISPDYLLKEQLNDFGFEKDEIETFVLLKNYKTTNIKYLKIELDKYTYANMKDQARKDAIAYLTTDTPIQYPAIVNYLLNENLPDQIPFELYTKHESNVQQLYKQVLAKDNDKFTMQFILKLIDKYKKYVIKIKNFSLNIKNTTNTSLHISTKHVSRSKTLNLRLHELIPILDKRTEITSNTIPLHLLDISTAGNEYKTVKFNELFKNIDSSEYLSNPAPHSANYYVHKEDILVPTYKHIMTDETKQQINDILAKAITEKSTTGKSSLSDEDIRYINQEQYLISNNKSEDGYRSMFAKYTQNPTYNNELYCDDNITSNATVIKILTAVANIL